jgi:hypothetical protein
MIGCVCSSFLRHSLHAVLPTTQWVFIAGDLNVPPTIYKFLGSEICFYIHIWTHIWQMIRIDFLKDPFSKMEQLNQIPHHCQSKHFCQENEWSIPWGKSAQSLEVWLLSMHPKMRKLSIFSQISKQCSKFQDTDSSVLL